MGGELVMQWIRRDLTWGPPVFPLVGPYSTVLAESAAGGLCLKAFSILTSRRVNQGVFKTPNVLSPFLGILTQLVWNEAQALLAFKDSPGDSTGNHGRGPLGFML